ncbi:MAG: aspartate-semialdehyde dehydrogenase [Coriobacteriales bacterium]|jgi:aspartate-semialdehyde dehydrogenase|nr:aspartate-semialdehyde dehydrogenase [Coriobacteriales bacterium]
MSWIKPMPTQPVVAVAGATGAVGVEMLKILAERKFPASRIKALASARSAGRTLTYPGGELIVEELTEQSFADVDIALFSAGGNVSLQFAEAVVAAGAVMIDNSSALRMAEGVPLVIPEVNPQAAFQHSGIIANPNCSTIQMVLALAPLHRRAAIQRVVVSTYQAASGAGANAMAELYEQTRQFLDDEELTVKYLAHRIAFNVIPHIDVFMEDGSTKEEWKMAVETKKILDDESIEVVANCVRVPVLRSHSEMINVQFSEPMDVQTALELWQAFPGIEIIDNPAEKLYPMPAMTAGSDAVYLGRIRKDPTVEWGINFWCVSDQLRKGAALNAIQIAELLLPA